MYKATPSALFPNVPSAPTNVHNCTIVDASALLYQPCLRAAVVEEQVALLATRLAMARWTCGNAAPLPPNGHDEQPYRAAFYARAQDQFFAWIERGGVWGPDDTMNGVQIGERVAWDLENDGAAE
jgi:hypothetical protein